MGITKNLNGATGCYKQGGLEVMQISNVRSRGVITSIVQRDWTNFAVYV
jgi:hypothetical protein